MRTQHVRVVPYDEGWKAEFEKLRQDIAQTLGSFSKAVDHVGSTSVEGLWAKPILDIDVVIADDADFSEVVRRLAAIGYDHEGDLGIPGREAFCYRDKPNRMAHHLYVCRESAEELFRHRTFRDYLRAHPKAVEEYSLAKREAARRFPEDIDGYVAWKSPCIEKIYRLCGLAGEEKTTPEHHVPG